METPNAPRLRIHLKPFIDLDAGIWLVFRDVFDEATVTEALKAAIGNCTHNGVGNLADLIDRVEFVDSDPQWVGGVVGPEYTPECRGSFANPITSPNLITHVDGTVVDPDTFARVATPNAEAAAAMRERGIEPHVIAQLPHAAVMRSPIIRPGIVELTIDTPISPEWRRGLEESDE